MIARYFSLFCCFYFISIAVIAQTDQQLVWGSYIAGEDGFFNEVTSIAEMPDGGFVICGSTESSYGLATVGAYQEEGDFSKDGYLAFFDADRELVGATYFSGNQIDSPGVVRVLSDGSIVMSGSTFSDSGIATMNAFQSSMFPGNLTAGFLTRFSNADTPPLWSTFLSGSGMFNAIGDMTIFENDDILVVGSTDSPDFPTTEDALQDEYGGGNDGIISRFNSDGELLWSSYFGGPGNDYISAVVLDSEENFIVLGYTESENQISTNDVHQDAYGGEGDLFVAKFNESGNLLWSTYFGGLANESGISSKLIQTDTEGNIYIAGLTESLSGIATAGAYQTQLQPNDFSDINVFVAKLSPTGEQIWGSYFGNYANLTVSSMALSSHGLIITGSAEDDAEVIFGNSWQPVFPGPVGPTNGGSVYFTAFNSSGFPIWGTFYGGSMTDVSKCILEFSDSTLALTGLSSSSEGVSTPDGFQTENNTTSGFFSFFEIDFSTSIAENENLSMSIFPNPARESVRINLPPEFAFRADIAVYNSIGQVVEQHAGFNSLQTLALNHPPGLYIVEARNGNRVALGKVLVE